MDCFVASLFAMTTCFLSTPLSRGTTPSLGDTRTAHLRLQRRQYRLRNIRRAVAAAEFHRLDAVSIDLVDGALDALAGFGGGFNAMLVGQPVQHHRGREDHPGRIGFALPHDIGRGAVTWLEPVSYTHLTLPTKRI